MQGTEDYTDNETLNNMVEVETNEESGGIPNEVLNGYDQNVRVRRSSNLVDSPDAQDPPLSLFGDEERDSDIVEHDVKVCDICGDAGREDLLAICSRCSDGAEHTYCMREMLDEVPDGYWLCEECKITEENDNQKKDDEGRKTNKVTAIQVPSKRKAENWEDSPTEKRKALEISIESPKSPSSITVAQPSKDSSFKNLNMGTVRPAHQISHNTQLINDVAESVSGPNSTPRFQSAKGTFTKSNSFSTLSSKPEVKVVEDAVLQKKKASRERTSFDMDGHVTSLIKSKSFKTPNSGRPNAAESKVKMLSSTKLPPVQELKGPKHVKERNSFERKGLSKLNHPTVNSTKISSSIPAIKSRGDVLHSSVHNKRDLKVVQTGDKLNALSKSTNQMAYRGPEIAGTSVGAARGEEKSGQINAKDGFSESGTFCDAGKPFLTANSVLPAGFSRSRESTNQFEKSDESSIGHSRQKTLITDSRSIPCQKCKEIGHDREFYTVNNTAEMDVSAVRSLKEKINKENKLKAAISAAMLKKPGLRIKKNGLLDKSDESASNKDFSTEIPFQEQSPYPNNLKTIYSAKMMHEPPVVMKQFAHHPTERDLSSHTSPAICVNLMVSANPESEHIWQGDFELKRSGKHPDLCDGIQAYVSTYASPKVREVVNKFSLKISLNEVPRLSTWPSQFHELGVKDNNIALYFFAKDLDSYHRNYKNLVESVMKNDIALKGDINGVELLIFSSNHLPWNYQRWNALYFLWGVFRARRVNGLDQNFGSSKKQFIPSMNVPPLENIIPPVVMYVPEISKGEDSSCTRSINESSAIKTSACLKSSISLSSRTIDGDSATKISSVDHTCIQENSEKQDRKLLQVSESFSRTQTSNLGLHPEAGCNTATNEPMVPDCKLDVQTSVSATRTSYDLNEVEKMPMHSHLLGASWRSSPFVNGNNILVDRGSPSKKMKTDSSRTYEDNQSSDSSSKIDDLASQTGQGTLMVEERHDKACEKKVIQEDLEYNRRYFPVDMHTASNLWLAENSRSLKKFSLDENQIQERVPNLELALGADQKTPNRVILPFLGGMVDERKNKETVGKQDEAVCASLSLSLSFSSPEKDQSLRPVPKAEQLLPERNVNTSLQLYDGFSNK